MKLLSAIDRMEIKFKIANEKVNVLLPKLMEEYGIDMWIVSDKDDMTRVFLKEPTNGNSTFVFINVNGKIEAYQNTRHPEQGSPFFPLLEKGETVKLAVKALIEETKPKNIALNISKEFAELDGASHRLYEDINEICGDTPIISAELLAMDFSQIRTDDELELYEVIAEFSRDLIKKVLSSEMVTPGVTTNLDLRDYMLEEYQKNGLIRTWGPNVDMQRKGVKSPMIGMGDTREVIERGDLLHIDFGCEYIGLHTDMQYIAYVLKEDEDKAPESLVAGFEQLHDFQKIYMDVVKTGITGNEARVEILKRAENAKMEAMVYSHPIGHSVHSVGPSIGRFGSDSDIPHGVYTVKDKTCFAMEQNVRVIVPEWDNQKVFIFREEDIVVKNSKVEVIGGLQENLYLI